MDILKPEIAILLVRVIFATIFYYYYYFSTAVNWDHYSSIPNYFRSASYARDVGRYTRDLIQYLIEELGVSLDNIHIIGHSLGAHVAGFAGSYVKSGQVSRITGNNVIAN